jgi:hypothetical protein
VKQKMYQIKGQECKVNHLRLDNENW